MSQAPHPLSPPSPQVEPAAHARRSPSLLMANVFMIMGLLILVFVPPRVDDTVLNYIIGVGIEFALALLAILFMALERLNVRRTARLHWPGWQSLLWTLIMAPGLWLMAISINIATSILMGYTTPVPPTLFPETLLGAGALALATVVAAPLCEELMFRGYVQPAYERAGPWIGVPATALLFTLYHLRFQGGPALLPVSLVLGLVAWRTHSLLPGILLHALYNGVATVLSVATAFLPMQAVGALIMMGLCVSFISLPLVPLGLWMLWRTTSPPQTEPAPRRREWLRWLWPIPLAALLLFYSYASVTEVIVGAFPQHLAEPSLDIEPPKSWDTAPAWTYGMYDALNQPVGTATCSVASEEARLALHCTAEREAFSQDLLLPERWMGIAASAEAATWEHRITWAPTAQMNLVGIESRRTVADSILTTALIDAGATELVLNVAQGNEQGMPLLLPADVLIQGEWPWRLTGLPFSIAYGAPRPFLWFDDEGTPHIEDAYVLVEGGEPVWTPAGNFAAWKVTVTYQDADGREVVRAAWYDADTPYTLVRYDDGVVHYLLEE